MRLFFVLVLVLASCGEKTSDGKKDIGISNPNGKEGDQEQSPGGGGNDDVIKKEACDDLLNPILVKGECYKHCDQTGNYCLKHNEMGSQLDPTKKIPLCSQSDGNFLIDDVCARGVITIDRANDSLKIGNEKSDKYLFEYKNKKYSFNELVKYSFHYQLNHNYETKFPSVPETQGIYELSRDSISFNVVISPGSLDHPKLPYILEINGHTLDMKDLSADKAKAYCNKVLSELFLDYRNYVKISKNVADHNNNTFYTSCTVEGPTEPIRGSLSFYCHGEEDRCYPNWFTM